MKRPANLKRFVIFCLLAVVLAFGLTACGDDGNETADGDAPDGDTPDGDTPDGDTPDGDTPDGDEPDGDTPDGDEPDGDEPSQCWNDIPVGEPTALATGLMGSEGIAFSQDGRLFISTKGAVAEIKPDGTVETFKEMPHPLGMAFQADGKLMVCDMGETISAGDENGSMWLLDSTAAETVMADTIISNPNFVTRTPWGTWLISDDMAPEIWEMTDAGEASLWCEGVPSPNGMVFNADGSILYVAGTFEDPGPVYRIPITDGEAGEVSLLANTEENGTNDGVAMDADGNVLIAVNVAGNITRITADGETEVLASGMLTPASIAFGIGEDFDPCSIYVTELLGDKVWRINLGVEGMPLFY